MNTPRFCAALGAAVLGAATSLPIAAHAQANCEMYGKLALQQQQENVNEKCGFSGPEWSPDLKAHIVWCGSVGPEAWRAQLQKRKQQLDACKAK